MQVIEFLLVLQKRRFVGRFVRQIMMLIGVDVPRTVTIGRGLRVYHRGYGLVVHPKTIIGDNVRLYHGVTIDPGVPETIRQRAVQMAGVLGVDAVASTGTTGTAAAAASNEDTNAQ